MIFKSIKWRLQLWYGLVLVAVLVGFGVTAYQLERNRQFRRVDDEIHRRIGSVVQQLHRPPRGPRQGPPEEGFPPPEFREGDMPGPGQQPPPFKFTPQLAALFDTNNPDQYYFAVERRNGEEVAHSDFQPPASIAELRPHEEDTSSPTSPQPPVTLTGQWREFHEHLPSGETIYVGCSIAREQKELRLEALVLLGVGGVILFFGMAGGWWFVGRALRPISEISSTAAKISAGDLAQRINSEDAESELGQLIAVLNATFARLETAFAQQKQFASDAAHELRTPVSVILTQTQMTLNRERDAAGYKQTVEACQRAAQRMRKLIETLLELARFDAGQEVLKRQPFDLSRIVSDAAEMIQPLAGEQNVKIVSNLKPATITGDSERIFQVITNLLTNAIQYNRPNGEVRLKSEVHDGLAILEISDTGNGIAAADLPHVFERFYRADKSRTGAGNSGLGLSICKAIVEAHGGTIEVSSVEAVGTTFTVRLPTN